MTVSIAPIATLAEFLDRPDLEDSPAWEYLDGVAVQKPMPKFRHSLLQKRLIRAIDAVGDRYTAMPELRCTFGDRSIVPDVAVIAWERVALTDEGEPIDQFLAAPDWIIEILSPEQPANRVMDQLLHSLQFGSRLAWLVDPQDQSILALLPDRPPLIGRRADPLPCLPDLPLTLTAEQIFGWLKVGSQPEEAS
ncbi:Uma2 family endonuclease [Limnothrix redekei]|uniref:Uma2 family endonuclease n=1 Tax=Limnothrix redekei LRLZ20PSL1 TaxID=3112953 RepID=A0ABW7C9Z3_9CYAN